MSVMNKKFFNNKLLEVPLFIGIISLFLAIVGFLLGFFGYLQEAKFIVYPSVTIGVICVLLFFIFKILKK